MAAGVQQAGAPAGGWRITDSFTGSIPRFRLRPFYGLGMFVIACAMVLLPLAYLCLIALVGYGVYHHAVNHTWFYTDAEGSVRVRIFMMAVYGAPFAIGPLIIAFMLKPIFARQAHERHPLTLDRSQEPVLYSVLEKLCAAVRAPMPREIEVDCELNASAGFRRGLWSLFARDMSLVIGLPLAAGLPLQQFMGILAHELGHFSQGFGMRLSFIVRSINGWFGRVVYERDAWDVWLIESSRETDIRIGIFIYIARLGVWLNRKVLWLLMMIGHCICCAFLRQMEYDADHVAADVVGAKPYREALVALNVLSVAEAQAQSDLRSCWREKRLPDNLPLLIAARARELKPEIRNKVVEHALSARTGLIHTHPSLSRRLAAVDRRAAGGVFRHDAPATALFTNFRMIANAVTLTDYRRGYGIPVDTGSLFPTEDLLKQNVKTGKDVSASERYFAGCHHLYLPVVPETDRIGPPKDPRAAVAVLKKLRGQFDAAAEKYAAQFKKYAETQERLSDLHVADLLMHAGFKRLDKKSFGIKKSSGTAVMAARAEIKAKLDEVMPKIESMNKLQRRRLTTALGLACVPAVAQKLRTEESPAAEIARLLPILRRFESNSAKLPSIARDLSAAAALIENAPEGDDIDEMYPKLVPLIKRLTRESWSAIEGARFTFQGIDYPFEHARGSVSMAEYLATGVTSDRDPVAILMASNETTERMVTVYWRSLGRLAHIAERVERALGMPPVERKPVEDDESSAIDGLIATA